jgi:uncharacterized protein DUF3833
MRTTSRSFCLALLVSLSLLGCASVPTPADYADQQPKLELRQYFNGPLTAHGIFTDRSGRIAKRFTVQMVGRWSGDQGVLEEDFVYSDGSKQRRVWRITDHGQGRYTGQADDVVGQAEGQAAGNTLQWAYTLRLPVDGKTYEVQFNDWMILMDEHTMLNRAAMSKFGIHLGDVTLSFHKP